MAILRVRDNDGNIVSIPAIKGDKGDKGDKGAGVIVGKYTGDGMYEKTMLIDGDVKAVLILNQYGEASVDNNGFVIRGGMVTIADPLKYGNIPLANISNPVSGTSQLTVNNYDFMVGTAESYTMGFNISGTTYHYIAFTD